MNSWTGWMLKTFPAWLRLKTDLIFACTVESWIFGLAEYWKAFPTSLCLKTYLFLLELILWAWYRCTKYCKNCILSLSLSHTHTLTHTHYCLRPCSLFHINKWTVKKEKSEATLKKNWLTCSQRESYEATSNLCFTYQLFSSNNSFLCCRNIVLPRFWPLH